MSPTEPAIDPRVVNPIGGFRDLASSEDQVLIRDLLRDGVSHLRTHGYGMLTHRHGMNTWQASTDYLLARAKAKRPGLALGGAMGERPASSGGSKGTMGVGMERIG